MFVWRYHDSITTSLYKPSEVFKRFTFSQLLDSQADCACLKVKRFAKFLDDRTLQKCSSFDKPQVHVRTTDVNIIQHPDLRHAIGMGLNHIPLKPIDISVSIATILDAFRQLTSILDLENAGLPLTEATEWVRKYSLEVLKSASRTNKAGHRVSGSDLMKMPSVKNEINWITNHLFCAGLDKASNNACFICIRHIRLLALERLSIPEFRPCKIDTTWTDASVILEQLTSEIANLVPGLSIPFANLPYLMASYKLHKNKYRWLTNAFQTVYTNIAQLLTITTMQVLVEVKKWAASTAQGYTRFLRCHTSLFWLIDSSIDVALNLPNEMHDIFVGDITRYYETIPLEGPDNLSDVVAHIIKLGFTQAKTAHSRATPLIWVRSHVDGHAARATWNTTCPSYGTWFSLNEDQLVRMHTWLMKNCHVMLGDRVWIQQLGIPIGFSCSPLWCNMYLLHYEITFIQRLTRLGRSDLLNLFQYAYRYIDDICWVHTYNPQRFLSPQQERSQDNPFWIYPLNVLEIKSEVCRYSTIDPLRGLQANFMNIELSITENEPSQYTLRKYDKRRSLPFQYTQYIKFKSNRPIKQSYNIAISQTVPILYISSTWEAAAAEIDTLIRTMVGNGFREGRLRRILRQFLASNSFPGIRFEIQSLCNTLNEHLYN